MRRLLPLLAVSCAGPFAAVAPRAEGSGVAIVYCGSATASSESVMKSLEPPTGPTGSSESGLLPALKEASICLDFVNRGSKQARINRGAIRLRCPRETDDWVSDRDDQEVIAQANETRRLHVAFHYSPLPRGEDVQLSFDGAVTVGGHAVKVAPLKLRQN
jgi:hypothetical protein